jgi:hypothetical protein
LSAFVIADKNIDKKNIFDDIFSNMFLLAIKILMEYLLKY